MEFYGPDSGAALKDCSLRVGKRVAKTNKRKMVERGGDEVTGFLPADCVW